MANRAWIERAAWVAAAAALVACGDDGGVDGTGGSGASGGAGGDGGLGGNAAGGGGTTGDGGAGAAGGSPPAGCDPDDELACDAGEVCAVVDETLGLEGGTACIAPGTKPVFAACAGLGECEAGAFCDFSTATCKPLCENSLGCPSESACTPAQTAAGAAIPGLKLCVAPCEPVATTVCDSSEGPVNCTWREDLASFDCVSAGAKAENAPCTEHAECGVGMGCLEVNRAFACLHWCEYDGGTDICTREHPDAMFAICVPQAPSISQAGVDYGGCLKQL